MDYKIKTEITYIDIHLVDVLVFPGGEVHPRKLTDKMSQYTPDVTLKAVLRNAVDIQKLFAITNAIREINPEVHITLDMPYVPYARQDRVVNRGECHGIKMFASQINAQKYNKVLIVDPHSSVTTALIDRVQIKSLEPVMDRLFDDIPDQDSLILAAPDQGAIKRVSEVARDQVFNMVSLIKKRDLQTGNIMGMGLLDPESSVKGKNVLIIDDICDGGRTFEEAAKILKAAGANKLYLYVTHGIFSKGSQTLSVYFEKIYTTNSFYNESLKGVTTIKL